MTIEHRTIQALSEEQAIKYLNNYLFGSEKIFTKPVLKNQSNDVWYKIEDGPIKKTHITYRTLWEHGSPNPNNKLKAKKQTSYTELSDTALEKMEFTNSEEITIFIYRTLIKKAIELLDNESKRIIEFYSQYVRDRKYLSGHNKNNIRAIKRRVVLLLIPKIIKVEETHGNSIAS